MRRRLRFNSIKSLIGSSAHIEKARGNIEQNIQYCTKDNSYYEYGEKPHNRNSSHTSDNNRNSIATQFIEYLKKDSFQGILDFSNLHPGQFLYYGHTLKNNYISLLPPIHRPNIKVFWYFGPTGTNKSRTAYSLLNQSVYIKESKTKWWHNYLGEKHCIIDDFTPRSIDIQYLLRWFDRYPCSIETKGSTANLQVELFIITSNYHPSEVYPEVHQHSIDALLRRIQIIHFPDEENIAKFHFHLYHLCCPQLHVEDIIPRRRQDCENADILPGVSDGNIQNEENLSEL